MILTNLGLEIVTVTVTLVAINSKVSIRFLSLVQETIAFDTLFIVQHYVLFSERSPIPTYHAIDADESKDGVGNNKGDA